MMRIAITIFFSLACLCAFSQRERQIAPHGLIHYTPYAKFDSVRTTYFRISTGASNGYVLTSDANGVGTWQAASGGGGGHTGTGTADYLARWTGSTALGIGVTRDDGTNVGIGTAPGTYKLNVNGSFAAQGAIHSIGAASAYQVYNRANSAHVFSIFSNSGNLDFYDIAGSATRLFMTPGGVLKYSADMSASYDSRSVVDKAYVDASAAGGLNRISYTANGDGSTTVFNVPHALGGTANYYIVTPKSAASAAPFYLTSSNNNVSVTYLTAPPAGTNNVSFVLYYKL